MSKTSEAVLKRREMFVLDPYKVVVREGWNPRKKFDTDDDKDFTQFVINNGPKFPPVFVKSVGDNVELIDGERRLRAVKGAIEAGCPIDGIQAIFIDKNTNEIEQLSLALTANQGKELEPMEEAEACKRLKDWGLSEEQIGIKIGKSASHVRNRLVLANASPAVASAVKDGTITQGEAIEAVKSSDGSIEKQNEKLKRIKKPAAQRAVKMMTRIKLEKQIDSLIKKVADEGIDIESIGNADPVGVLVGMMMVLKNVDQKQAEGDLFLKITEKNEADAVANGKAPWEV